MQRDMDLIRQILLEVEKCPLCDGHHFVNIDIPGRSIEEVNYHIRLLEQAGYIIGSQTMLTYSVSSLTWEGHEFLDNIKDPKIWDETKEKAKEIPGVGLKIVGEIATGIIKAHFGLP